VSVPLVTLVILDGWGIAPAGPGNAVELARTPVFDDLWARYPHTQLAASGEAVGLPAGQMGNSEVGHLTIGSGRILLQDLMRVNRAIADRSFFDIDALIQAFAGARERDGAVHLLGLVSHGGVHSHIEHLLALLELAEQADMSDRTWIHAFTDGRDVSPFSATHDLGELPAGRIASDGTAPSGRSTPSSAGSASTPTTPSQRCRRATSAESPTSSSNRSSSVVGRGSMRAPTPQCSSTSDPTVAGSSLAALSTPVSI
jgi:BPG-independent PGAM N-terminus (iPGM_N)/Metalloenzyme superfamily